MAKYCADCGKELVDGKCLECKGNQKKEHQEKSSFDTGACVNALVEMGQKMFSSPKDVIQKYAKEKYFQYALIAMAISCVLTGTLGYLLMEGILSNVLSLSYSFSYGYTNMNVPTMPTLRVLITTTLYAVIYFAVIFGMIYVMVNIAFKKEVNMKKVVASFGPIAIFSAITQVICIILYYLSFNLMAIVFLLFNLCTMVYMIQAIKISTDVDDNRLAYTYVPAVAVALFVIVYILPRLFN